ncbi:MAG: Arc family DNA-binding protein [Ignavibacteriae bacterium]|nr:Arc family DNA-binding protein [Ignavibacteriota bacterium]NOG97873.1 Arc family DNA-binding protein [Ignavibacteriota bacterium]
MPSITIKNISDGMMRKLKRRAKLNRRSLNSEIIQILDDLVNSSKIDINKILQKAAAIREKIEYSLSDKELTKFKNEGRR